jgi:hypothetical protein
MVAGDCALPARQHGGRLYFSGRQPPLHVAPERPGEILARVSKKIYETGFAVPLVRHDFAAAITALSSLSVSPARKPRIRRND